MLSMRWNQFPVCSTCDEISSPYAQCAIKFVPRMLSMDCTWKNVHILPLAEHARKFIPHMPSMRWNRFRVCSACDKIVSACSARDWERSGLLEENAMLPGETQVWSESSVDERNLYSTRSAIIGLAVETWRVKTKLIIITILHIIIITVSILNLGFKTIAPKILAHATCINRYWNTYKY